MAKGTAILDQYAQDHFGEEMRELGFCTFNAHRWYKLIRDEVLLSFGLTPTGYYGYDVQIGFQPTFIRDVPPSSEALVSPDRPFMHDIQTIVSFIRYPYLSYSWGLSYLRTDPQTDQMVESWAYGIAFPILSRITDMRSACEEAIWLDFVTKRYRHGQEMPPTPINYKGFGDPTFTVEALCFLRMFDVCLSTLNELRAYYMQKTESPTFYNSDYLDAIEKGDYDWIDRRLHENYETSLKAIKRKLKLEPDCKDTLWDRDYRHPIDIQTLLRERFERAAPRAAEGDYTIKRI